MKKFFFIASLLGLLVMTPAVFASFPVNEEGIVQNDEQQGLHPDIQEVANEFNLEEQMMNETSGDSFSSLAMDEMVILLLLWFFLGAFAAHRWYAGKPVGWNILFILTGGGCGVWAIVDLVHILQERF